MGALADSPREGWSVIYMDTEYIQTPEEFLTELTAALLQVEPVRNMLTKAAGLPKALARWLGSAVESLDVGEIKIRLRSGMQDSRWEDLAEQVLAQLRTHSEDLLLIIDEFPVMIGNFIQADQNAAIHFLKWFRGRRQDFTLKRIRYLVGGSVNIEPRLEQLGCQALLNDFQRFQIRGFSLEQAEDFVVRVLTSEGVSFDASAPAEIVRIVASGVPFFLQVLISECISETRRTKTRITAAVVATMYRTRVLGPSNRARFSHYQSRLKEHYGQLEHSARILLSDLASRGACTPNDLAMTLTRRGGDASALDQVLTMLEGDYYILRTTVHVEFSSGFLRDWWSHNVPLAGDL